jgi:hypothetical protein
MLFALLSVSCVGAPGSAPASAAMHDVALAEFSGTGGTIGIDLQQLTLRIGSAAYPLANCSTAQLYCFENEALGFHLAVPKTCLASPRPEGELAGGFRFFQIAVVEHGDPREGRYVSSLSDRFAYGYYVLRGIHEIRYDPSGQWRFGPQSAGDMMGRAAREAYTYRLPEGQAFLRCR